MPKRVLTDEDLKLLRETFPTKEEVEAIVDRKLEEKIGRLPTKEEFTLVWTN
jgi:hypothetical protein